MSSLVVDGPPYQWAAGVTWPLREFTCTGYSLSLSLSGSGNGSPALDRYGTSDQSPEQKLKVVAAVEPVDMCSDPSPLPNSLTPPFWSQNLPRLTIATSKNIKLLYLTCVPCVSLLVSQSASQPRSLYCTG